MHPLCLLPLVLLVFGCGSSEPAVSADIDAYGRSPQRPILVAGLDATGPSSQRAYLDRLRGPAGETVTYERQGSCCAFETPNGISGYGMLDIYHVRYAGQTRPVALYLNMYDPPEGDLHAPDGFGLAE
jgi:hypothetical protein